MGNLAFLCVRGNFVGHFPPSLLCNPNNLMWLGGEEVEKTWKHGEHTGGPQEHHTVSCWAQCLSHTGLHSWFRFFCQPPHRKSGPWIALFVVGCLRTRNVLTSIFHYDHINQHVIGYILHVRWAITFH